MARYVFTYVIRIFMALGCATGFAAAQPADDAKPLAIIGSSEVTEEDVRELLAGRRAYAGLPEDARFEKMLETLVAEYLVDYMFGRDLSRLSKQVLNSLSDARRQVLFQLYAQSQFERPEITEAAVDAFVEENSHLFSERQSYRFLDLTIAGGSEDARRTALERAQSAVDGAADPFGALNQLVPDLNTGGLEASLTPAWATSESLPDETRAVLRQMAKDARERHIIVDDSLSRLLVLLSSTAMPTDADALRPQIEQRLLQIAFSAHREEMIALLAKPVLTRETVSDDRRAIEPPPRGTVVWSAKPVLPREIRLAAYFGLCLFLLTAIYGLASWGRLAYAQVPGLRSTEAMMPMSKTPVVTSLVFGVLALVVLGTGVGASWASATVFGLRITLVLFFGACLLALGLVLVWHKKITAYRAHVREELEDAYPEPETLDKYAVLEERAGRRFLISLGLIAAGLICLAILLDPAALGLL